MRIRRDIFAVANGVRAEDGTKAEPEEQPTRSIIEGTMPATLGTSGAAGAAGSGGNMKLLITHDAPAGEMAAELAARCAGCRNFKRKAWRQLVEECDFPTAPLLKRQALNEVRSALLLTRNAKISEAGSDGDGDFDVEGVLRTQMGLCSVLSDIKKDYVVVHQIGCCPQTTTDDSNKVIAVKTPAQPTGYFIPRDAEARAEAMKKRDAVLLTAAGKGNLL